MRRDGSVIDTWIQSNSGESVSNNEEIAPRRLAKLTLSANANAERIESLGRKDSFRSAFLSRRPKFRHQKRRARTGMAAEINEALYVDGSDRNSEKRKSDQSKCCVK